MVCHCFVHWCLEMVVSWTLLPLELIYHQAFCWSVLGKKPLYIFTLFLFREMFLSNRLSALAIYLEVLFLFLLFSLFYTNLLFVTGNKIAQKKKALGHCLSTYANFILITILYVSNSKQYVITSRRTRGFYMNLKCQVNFACVCVYIEKKKNQFHVLHMVLWEYFWQKILNFRGVQPHYLQPR